jgi:hypothetical protein
MESFDRIRMRIEQATGTAYKDLFSAFPSHPVVSRVEPRHRTEAEQVGRT